MPLGLLSWVFRARGCHVTVAMVEVKDKVSPGRGNTIYLVRE